MPMIKAIFLDFEGVVTKNGKILHTTFYEKNKNYFSYEELEERYMQASTGEMQFEDFAKGIPSEHLFDYLSDVKYNLGAEEALKQLQKKYSIFIASNHIPILFEKEIEKLDCKKYFKELFMSAYLKIRKPNPQFFTAMLKKTGFSSQESIFVDDAKRNLVSAHNVGMKTVWMNNNIEDARNEHEFIADYTISDLRELVKIVSK